MIARRPVSISYPDGRLGGIRATKLVFGLLRSIVNPASPPWSSPITSRMPRPAALVWREVSREIPTLIFTVRMPSVPRRFGKMDLDRALGHI